MAVEPLNDDIVAIVRGVLQQEMTRFGLRQVDVNVAPDHDGDPILQVDARYDEVEQPVDPKIMAGVVTKLRDRLWERGEQRFPHIRHHFAEDRKVVGFK